MRQIKFRGKRKDTGGWIYGDLVSNGWGYFIINHFGVDNGKIVSSIQVEVISETVGQFTGLRDKGRVEIYMGDVVRFVGGTCNYLSMNHYGKKHEIGTVLVVTKLLSGYTLQLPIHVSEDAPNLVGNVDNYQFWNHQRSLIVIGNIYENPELLK